MFKRVMLVALCCTLAACNLAGGTPGVPGAAGAVRSVRAFAPLVVASNHVAAFKLSSAIDSATKLPEFVYEGQPGVEPTIVVDPGDTIVVDLHDGLSGSGMASDLNLHFHGLGVSPQKPSDDVLTMLAHSGQTLHYVVHVPTTQPPGLYWYHPHVHGETEYQVGEGGMSGAIVVNGIAKSYPQLKPLAEQVLVVRVVGGAPGDEESRQHALRLAGKLPHSPCPIFYSGILTVNGQVQPVIGVPAGKPQFFGIVNATGHRTLDLSVDRTQMQVVAVDGYPLKTSAGGRATMTQSHVVLAPAGRVEFLATVKGASAIRTACYDSGPVGDPDPGQELVALKTTGTSAAASPVALPAANEAYAAPAALPPPAAQRVVTLTENTAGFYINGKAFNPSAPPMFVVHTGTVERWTVNNLTSEMHDFHVHQVHFLVTSIDGTPVAHPIWTDTFVVPWQKGGAKPTPGSVEMIVDFRSKVIRGTFLFHCHILDHEDQGMMAKIQAL